VVANHGIPHVIRPKRVVQNRADTFGRINVPRADHEIAFAGLLDGFAHTREILTATVFSVRKLPNVSRRYNCTFSREVAFAVEPGVRHPDSNEAASTQINSAKSSCECSKGLLRTRANDTGR